MEIKEFRAFILLAEQLHFGRTAEYLNMTQPALTRQIHHLEEELGYPLFKRGKNGTKLTAFGRQFLPEARLYIEHFERLKVSAQKIAQGKKGRLYMGFGFHTFELAPRLIVALRTSVPDVEVSLKDMSTVEHIQALRSEQIDIGFLRVPVPDEFDSIPVIEDQMVLVTSTSSGYPDELTLKDCAQEPFIFISKERSPTFYRQVLQLCAMQGFHPNIVQEVSEVTTALALIKAGLGVSLMPYSFCNTNISGIRLYMPEDANLFWSIAAAWRKEDTNPVLHRFLALLKADIGVSANRF